MSQLMNVMDLAILAVLAVSIIAGMYRGFLASGLYTMGFIGSWFVAKTTYLQLSVGIRSNAMLMKVLSQYLEADTFFESTAVANMSVSDIINSGRLADVANGIGEKLPFIKNAFIKNVQNSAFSQLNLYTMKDYLDQTVWKGIFNVASFVLIFALCYVLVVLIVNLFNYVFNFPALRAFDYLLGGVFGFVRGAVVVALLVTLIPMVANALVPDIMAKIEADSVLLPMMRSFDWLKVQNWMTALING